MQFILAIFWLIISSLIFIQFMDLIADLNPKEKVFVCIVILLGGPIFVAYQLLENILNSFFPEGWDEDDERGPPK